MDIMTGLVLITLFVTMCIHGSISRWCEYKETIRRHQAEDFERQLEHRAEFIRDDYSDLDGDECIDLTTEEIDDYFISAKNFDPSKKEVKGA